MMPKLLFVDDEPNSLRGIQRILRRQRKAWEMYFAENVDEALSLFQSIHFDAVITDISMPGKDGFELLRFVRNQKQNNHIPVLMMTGLNERYLKSKSLDMGATDLFNKPVEPEDLIARIKNMLKLKYYQDMVEKQKDQLEEKVKKRTLELEAANIDLVWRLAKVAEYRDTDTGNHITRVAYYCRQLSQRMELSKDFTQMIFLTSPLHDIGKVGIPDNILLKPGKLSPAEWKIMKKHSKIGADILKRNLIINPKFSLMDSQIFYPETKNNNNPFLNMAANIAHYHHERWDGMGYPEGICGTDIPLECRIASIADVYDALFSSRHYKPAYTENEVIEIMREENGKRFDPEIFVHFEKSVDIFREIRIQLSDEYTNENTKQ